MTAPRVRVVVTDSNVLINLLYVGRIELLGAIPGHEFVIVDHVREEITIATQREALEAAIQAGTLKVEAITELEVLAVFAELITRIGRGEAACIAIAAHRGWWIASDEKRRFRREAMARIGSNCLLGTADVFVMAIEAGLISVEHADADKLVLEQRRFKMPFASFQELIGKPPSSPPR